MSDEADRADQESNTMHKANLANASNTYKQATLFGCTKCDGYDDRIRAGYAVCEDCYEDAQLVALHRSESHG